MQLSVYEKTSTRVQWQYKRAIIEALRLQVVKETSLSNHPGATLAQSELRPRPRRSYRSHTQSHIRFPRAVSDVQIPYIISFNHGAITKSQLKLVPLRSNPKQKNPGLLHPHSLSAGGSGVSSSWLGHEYLGVPGTFVHGVSSSCLLPGALPTHSSTCSHTLSYLHWMDPSARWPQPHTRKTQDKGQESQPQTSGKVVF